MPEIIEPVAKRAETILVVDDEVLIRMVIAGYLRDCGFRVIEAVNSDEAIAVLTSETDVDIVFSDVEMPGSMDGFGLNRWIRDSRPDLPVILAGTPARASEAAADLCRQGPDLGKPYQPQLVLDRIRRLLAERGAPRRRPPQAILATAPVATG
jgi:CheY-like chemotaxis protein